MTIAGIDFAVLDIIFIVITAVVTIRASIRGFVDEFFSKVAIIAGAVVAILFYKRATEIIQQYSDIKTASSVIAFLILFLMTYIIIKIIQSMLGKIFNSEMLANFDKALGFFLGLIESLILILVVLFVLEMQPFFDVQSILQKSIIAKFLLPFIISASFNTAMLRTSECLKI